LHDQTIVREWTKPEISARRGRGLTALEEAFSDAVAEATDERGRDR
jgi:hypothetical protein